MCGFFGWEFRSVSQLTEYHNIARNSLSLLNHRGPDHQCEWTYQNIFIGHCRLSIIDLSESSNQPMVSSDKQHILAFNGEIYNYVEIREELANLGYKFLTESDTEVMLEAFSAWGIDALSRFDGMFAGVWYDKKFNRHVLFRDPLGQKPLYWHHGSYGLIYGSELQSIISLDHRSWYIDRNRFARYLANSYYAGEDTPITDIHKLNPGSFLISQGGAVSIHRYWNSKPTPTVDTRNDSEVVDHLENLLRESCRKSMRADVPLGVFLSGGLDSSLILDFCHEINPDISSFSIGMSDLEFDESNKAEIVRKKIGVRDHHSFLMSPSSIQRCLDEVFSRLDEPHADPGLINAYLLSESAKPHIKVGIAGDGADELFAGYAPFSALGPINKLCAIPFFWAATNRLASYLPESDSYLSLKFKINSVLQGFPGNSDLRLPLWLSSASPEVIAKYCGRSDDNFFNRNGWEGTLYSPYISIFNEKEGMTDIQKLLHYYQQIFLPEFVCMHTDRASMMHSLEVRSPFLSLDIIRYANSLPDKYKLRGNTKKWILRELAQRRGFSGEIINQRKQGFTFPIARWLKGPIKQKLRALIWDDGWTEDQLVDTDLIRNCYEDHINGKKNNYRLLYSLMVFRAWRQKFPRIQVSKAGF